MRFERIDLDYEGAYIDTYIADPTRCFTRKAILVIPGGGYGAWCNETEGEPIAQAFMPYGYNAFVLRYYTGKEKPPCTHFKIRLFGRSNSRHLFNIFSCFLL